MHDYSRFYRYEEFTAALKTLCNKHPNLLQIASIGKSHEGRDIWVVTATNVATGAAADKPAYWIDANIHASELAGSTAALYYLESLAKGYGQADAEGVDITRLLDTRTVYVCPRINPDGAEWAMRDTPKIVRSSTRKYPYDAPRVEGLDIEDVNGDGRILSMRIVDANGNWKCHETEPRLMVPRTPNEYGGIYYRIMAEGTIRNYDGVNVKVNRDEQGLDLNRNFPAGWRQEHEQLGAGPFPTSEPEVRAVVAFITSHPNISGGTSFHTWSGVLLRPFSSAADEEMPPEDLWVYKTSGAKGEEITGYPAISVFHEFRYHPKEVITGTFDWIYEHLGLYEWTIEIWCPMREAGITDYKYIDWFRSHPVADDLKLLAWSDRELGERGYAPWTKFNHPQLGEVEIGGWDKIAAFRNPPAHLLEREVAKFPKWLNFNALLSPKLEAHQTKVEQIAKDTFKVTASWQNTGYLPAYVSKRALSRKQSRGVIVDVTLPAAAKLVAGNLREELGELEGRAYKHTQVSFWTDTHPTADRASATWVIAAPAGTSIELVARHDKAGTVRSTVVLV